jgi:hypothetical protein
MAASRYELTVGAHEITAGPAGTVIQVVKGDPANSGTEWLIVYVQGANEVEVYASKARAPTEDDHQLTAFLIDAVPLERCTPGLASES